MGVKFYDFSNKKIVFGQEVGFVSNPDHRLDSNCVQVIVHTGRSKTLQLGNIEATVAEWLSPDVYSSENRSWKYRVVDVHVFICA